MLKLLAGWQGYAAAAVAAALLSISATYYITSLGYRLTIAGMEAANAEADAKNADDALKQFAQDADRIHAAADQFTASQATLQTKFTAISRDFANAVKANPMPLDCKPDAGRLHALSQAVAAANTAAGRQPIPAVPVNP